MSDWGMSEDPQEQAVGLAAAGVLYGMVRSMVDRGATPSTALRLAAFLVLDGTLGRGSMEHEIGVKRRTAQMYRAEIRSLLDVDDLADDVPPQYLADFTAALEDRMLWAAKGDSNRDAMWDPPHDPDGDWGRAATQDPL